MAESAALEPSSALVAYAESLVEGRRVLVIGNALSALPAQLLARGARWIYICDIDPGRVAAAASGNRAREVSFATLADGALALREGAFDVAIVENLGAVGDVVGVLKNIQRALTPKGVALIASPNPETRLHLLGQHDPSGVALDYYSLYDAVAAQFRQVRMLAQTPFVGYAIVDFAPDGELQPTIDAGFVPGGAEEPEWFVALCSQQPSQLDFFMLVQVRFAEAWRALARTEPVAAKPALPKPEARPAREARPVAAELTLLQKELAKRDAWIAELENRALAADTRADQTQSELDELQEQLAAGKRAEALNLEQARSLAATELERARAAVTLELQAALQQRDRLSDELNKLRSERLAEQAAQRVKISSLEARLVEHARELDALRLQTRTQNQSAQESQQELSALRAALRRYQDELQAAQAAAQEPAPELKEELGTLEQQLAERGNLVRKLEHDVRSAEQTGRELVLVLREYQADAEQALPPDGDVPQPSSEPANLRLKLDALASAHALQTADLAAAQWRVQYLETRLTHLPNGSDEASARLIHLERELGDARAALAGREAR